jgi:hypothetical protein
MYHMSSHFDFGNSVGILQRATLQVSYVKEVLLRIPLDKGHVTSEEYERICAGTENVFVSAEEMAKRIGAVA